MKKIELGALLVLVVITLSACNRGYGCPYGLHSDIGQFISSILPIF